MFLHAISKHIHYPVNVNTYSHSYFCRVNLYQVSADEDVGVLKKIIVRHDNSGIGPAWLLDKV